MNEPSTMGGEPPNPPERKDWASLRSASQGALPVARWISAAMVAGASAAVMGCPGPAPQTTPGGTGGATTSTLSSSSSTSTTSTTSTISSTTSSTTTTTITAVGSSSSSSGGVPCADSSQCPVSASACELSECVKGVCTTASAPEGTMCSNAAGGKVCDGNGACVPCIADTDCPPLPGACKGPMYTPQVCSSQKCMAGTPQNCSESTPPTVCKETMGCVPGRYVFVTTHGYPAALMAPSGSTTKGADAANAICSSIASLNMPKLGGTWRAWISDTGSWPAMSFTHSTVPYVLLDGSVVAADWTALTTPPLQNPIDVTEAGVTLVQSEVWTGTTTAGLFSGSSCGDWTPMPSLSLVATVGNSGAKDFAWTAVTTLLGCGLGNTAAAHLYCFQQ